MYLNNHNQSEDGKVEKLIEYLKGSHLQPVRLAHHLPGYLIVHISDDNLRLLLLQIVQILKIKIFPHRIERVCMRVNNMLKDRIQFLSRALGSATLNLAKQTIKKR